MGYKIFKFNKKASANRKANTMKWEYGYKPTIFKVRKGTTILGYHIAKPNGLKRIRK